MKREVENEIRTQERFRKVLPQVFSTVSFHNLRQDFYVLFVGKVKKTK